jgi:hypothetical protein
MSEELQQFVVQLLRGDMPTWEDGYRTTQFRNIMPEKARGAHTMRYGYEDRPLLYAYVHEKCVPDGAPIDFFEFGVFQGQSMRAWLDINRNPASRFFGFDCFEGLPEDWPSGGRKRGDFSCGGEIPDIDDPRVSFHKGLFKDTLPVFLDTYTPRNKVVVHMDADLFGSTVYALMQLDRYMPRGTPVVFDDFGPKDDFAALCTYAQCCGRQWEVIATRNDMIKIAVAIR